MSEGLVRRLRGQHNSLKSAYLKELFSSAADTIEALRGENARLRETIATATNFNEGLAAENARLKGALVEQVKQYPDYSGICRKALAGETT